MSICIAIMQAICASAQVSSDMFDFDSRASIRILGGDWRWEYFDDETIRGNGAGDIRIAWGDDLTARADSAVVARPPNRIELTGNVEVSSPQGTLHCESLVYDEAAGQASAVGDVEVVYTEPPLRVEADSVHYTLAESIDRFISFNGSVSIFTVENGALECDEIRYYTNRRVLSIPGACSGTLPMTFVDEPENPFYGRNARFTGDMLDVLVAEDGTFSYAISTDVVIETGNSYITSPILSVESSGEESQNAILSAFNDGSVTGWYVTPEGKRAEFSCRRLEIDRISGELRLSGRVNLNGEGFSVLTELLNLEYVEGAFTVSSDRRTEINMDDLFFEQ